MLLKMGSFIIYRRLVLDRLRRFFPVLHVGGCRLCSSMSVTHILRLLFCGFVGHRIDCIMSRGVTVLFVFVSGVTIEFDV